MSVYHVFLVPKHIVLLKFLQYTLNIYENSHNIKFIYSFCDTESLKNLNLRNAVEVGNYVMLMLSVFFVFNSRLFIYFYK